MELIGLIIQNNRLTAGQASKGKNQVSDKAKKSKGEGKNPKFGDQARCPESKKEDNALGKTRGQGWNVNTMYYNTLAKKQNEHRYIQTTKQGNKAQVEVIRAGPTITVVGKQQRQEV